MCWHGRPQVFVLHPRVRHPALPTWRAPTTQLQDGVFGLYRRAEVSHSCTTGRGTVRYMFKLVAADRGLPLRTGLPSRLYRQPGPNKVLQGCGVHCASPVRKVLRKMIVR